MKAGEYVDVWALSRTGHHVLKSMKWGLVPSYFRGFPNEWHGNTSHARIETVHELPSFKESWERKWRVLFPMAHYLQKTTGLQDLFGGNSRGGSGQYRPERATERIIPVMCHADATG